MKKQDIVNLVRYHVEQNNSAFNAQVADIARDFSIGGDDDLSAYLMELISSSNMYVPQRGQTKSVFLQKLDYSQKPLYLPDAIEEDVMGIVRAVNKNFGLSRFLFFGAPGTGKTESVFQIGRMLGREIFLVNTEQLIDSRLGETARNVVRLFKDINHLVAVRSLILFDEIDALVLSRSDSTDVREMGRVASAFLKELDVLSDRFIVFATTNLYSDLDKALIRRFDAAVSFDRYNKEDLVAIADRLLVENLKKTKDMRQDMRLFHKILNNSSALPMPGNMKQMIRSAIAFSDEKYPYDYLRKIYLSLNRLTGAQDIKELAAKGYTTREIEILARIPKSSVSRKLKGDKAYE